MNADPRPLIAHIVHRLDYGGLENGLVNLLNRLPADSFRHVVICLAGYTDFRARINRDDIEVVSIDKRPGKDLPAYFRMWRLLRRLRPALVHTRNLGTIDMQWTAWAAGVPGRLHSEHGWEASDPKGLNRRSLAIRRICRASIQRYLAVSADLGDWLRLQVGVPAELITVISNGVDIERFSPKGNVPDDGPWRQEDSASLFIVGAVGRLDPVKNHAALLAAFAELCARENVGGRKLRLVLVGGGRLEADLRQRAAELSIADRVWFAGARDDVPAMLRMLDVFALPSINEGMSNTLLEAMAAARPIVAARVGGNPELVKSGVNGLLYDPAQADGLEKSLATYYLQPDLCAVHGQGGLDMIRQRFSLDVMASRYAALYGELTYGSSN